MAGAPEGGPLRIGELVVCASRSFREESGIGLDVGMYLQGRSRDALVFFARPDRSLWVPLRALRAIDPADERVVPPPEWIVRVNHAVRLLDASDVELERLDEGGFEARIGCPGLDATLFREVERLAGGAAPQVRVRPGNMSRVLVVFPVGGPAAHAPPLAPLGGGRGGVDSPRDAS